MSKMKMTLFALLGLVVAVCAGWLWGAWGRWASETQWRDAELRAQFAEARASLCAARVDVFELNFGRASGDLEQAKKAMGAVAGELGKAGRSDAAAAVQEALKKAGEAQQLAGNVDQAANARVADAIAALARAGAESRK